MRGIACTADGTGTHLIGGVLAQVAQRLVLHHCEVGIVGGADSLVLQLDAGTGLAGDRGRRVGYIGDIHQRTLTASVTAFLIEEYHIAGLGSAVFVLVVNHYGSFAPVLKSGPVVVVIVVHEGAIVA